MCAVHDVDEPKKQKTKQNKLINLCKLAWKKACLMLRYMTSMTPKNKLHKFIQTSLEEGVLNVSVHDVDGALGGRREAEAVHVRLHRARHLF